MAFLDRTIRAVISCTAIALTLVSATPHYRCACPDGRVKLFCLGIATRGCCCGQACCTSSSSAHTGKKSCCRSKGSSSTPGYRAGCAGCSKTPAMTEFRGTHPEDTPAPVGVIAFLISGTTEVGSFQHLRPLGLFWENDLPPPDLVTWHQRLTI
jgi:hypothetical protein